MRYILVSMIVFSIFTLFVAGNSSVSAKSRSFSYYYKDAGTGRFAPKKQYYSQPNRTYRSPKYR